MTTHKPENSIQEIANEAFSIFETVQDIPDLLEFFSYGHRVFFEKLPEYIHSDKLKIAVVGVIKSGKSTFVNSILCKDVVKRGAGVVTSITTRIQKGKKYQAYLYLKSWDDINAGLRKLLLLISDDDAVKGIWEAFDIRRKNDRETLEKVHQKIINAFSPEKDTIHPEILSITHALQGFDALKDLVQPEETVICFESQEFDNYKDYTTDPGKAFYIKDVCLSMPVKTLDPNIEIADCQGADSTDSSQLERILAHIESSNLMIYCISSRTGLRESDMIFLKRIENLGLLDNVIFINNCDLTEHENLEDLLKVEAGILKDLSLLGIKTELYSFSLLYNHFANMKSKISKKDLLRFESWQKEKKMVQYCDLKTREFNLFFKHTIERNRYEFLISNHMKRLSSILSDLTRRIQIFLDLLSSDNEKEETAKKKLSDFYQNALRFETIMADSLENACQGLQKEIDINIYQMFFQDKDSILRDILEYVQLLSIEGEFYQFHGRETGVNEALFLLFKDFQKRVDLYVLEAVNPLLRQFVVLREERIKSFFQSYFKSYHVEFLTMDQYSDLKDNALSESQRIDSLDIADIDEIKKILGIQLPSRVFEVQYTSKMKTKVIANFGLNTVSRFLSSLLDKQSDFSFAPALKKSAEKIKNENLKYFKRQFEQYGKDLKTHYFLPLINAVKRDSKEKINERFRQYQSLNAKTEQFFSLKQSEKEDQKARSLLLKQRVETLTGLIEPFISL